MAFLKSVKLKPLDGVIIGLLFVLSFLPIFLMARPASASSVAELKAFGKVVKTLPLGQTTTYTYKHGAEENVVKVENHKVRVISANCPDKLDVKQGWISSPGQTIVCLPHALVITIVNPSSPEKPVKQDGKTVDYGG